VSARPAQRRVWTLLSYRSQQHGPSFPRDLDGHIDAESGRYTVTTQEKGTTKTDEGQLELPDDIYAFGMLAILLRNLEPGAAMAAHVLAFTPKPRILDLEVTPDGEDAVTIQGLPRKTSRYLAKARLGGVLGATLERRGLVSKKTVNLVSTTTGAIVAYLILVAAGPLPTA